jgi:hypothetical protein
MAWGRGLGEERDLELGGGLVESINSSIIVLGYKVLWE